MLFILTVYDNQLTRAVFNVLYTLFAGEMVENDKMDRSLLKDHQEPVGLLAELLKPAKFTVFIFIRGHW